MSVPMAMTLDAPPGLLKVTISEPIVVSSTAEPNNGEWMRVHPLLSRLPNGRLIVTINRERDIADAEFLVRASDDDGQTWYDYDNWPTSPSRGHAHASTRAVCLDDQHVLLCYNRPFATDDPETYILPVWRSFDGGATWSDLEPASVRMPATLAVDLYNRPADYPAEHPNPAFVKREPPAHLQPLFERFGRRRPPGLVSSVLHLGGNELLMFIYLQRAKGAKHQTLCLASDDAGRSWSYRSMPGPQEERFATENFLTHRTDGLCEPGPAILPNGNIFLAMRLGSRHPLYAVQSSDQGRTWTAPRALPVWGILPTVEVLPGGVMALCTGRPDVSFSLSFDGGYRWPWTWRFLEDGKPEDPSTRNSTMLQIAPGRILYMYDHGGYHPGDHGDRRILGHFIEVHQD